MELDEVISEVRRIAMDEPNRKTKSFEDLLVWQRAHSFVLKTYEITTNYPKQEQFGLTSQFR